MANEENLKPFKKGESGNPNGRPKGTRSRSTIVREWLECSEVMTNPITGEKETLQQSDIITLALIKKARKGDVQAFKELMDSGFGRTVQEIEQTINGGKPDKVEIIIRRPNVPDTDDRA